MKAELITILESLGFPVYLQGSMTGNYPESFFTFWNTETDDGNHYDDHAISYVWRFQINFYSVNPELVNTVLLEAKTILQQNGWIIPGKGYDVPSDDPEYSGRGITAQKLKQEVKKYA